MPTRGFAGSSPMSSPGQTADFYRRLGFRDTAVLAEHYGPGLDQHAMAAAVDDAFRRRLAAG